MTTIINGSSPSITFSDGTTQSTALQTPSAIGQIPFSANGTTYSPTAKIVSGTSQASTSGTSINFTGIPSWVKRITVMFSGVSTSSTSNLLLQIGNGSVVTTGYDSAASSFNAVNAGSTAGFLLTAGNLIAGSVISGSIVLTNFSTNSWVSAGTIVNTTVPASNGAGHVSGGNKTIGGALDRVRITTVNGTDTFDAGSINIMYE